MILGAGFFLMLTQHPFPDPARLACPAPNTTPRLIPLNSVQIFRDAAAQDMLLSLGPVSVVANLLVCAVIGAALALRTARMRAAVLLGLGLGLTAEFSQLTGLWGLYPCAYRQFDVDDILWNALGVVLGFAAARRLRSRPQT